MGREKIEPSITKSQALDWMISTSILSQYIWFGWGQVLMAKYFLWKVNKKFDRYQKAKYFQRKFREERKIKHILKTSPTINN